MTKKRLILSLVLSGVVSSFAAGQAQTPDTPLASDTEEQQKRNEREERAIALLEEVVLEAQSLRLPENRLRAQAQAADLLWSHNEARARAIFVEAMNGLGALINGHDTSAPDYYNWVGPVTQLRMEMLDMVARRDPQLALDFLRATRQPRPPQTDPYYRQPDPEAQMEMRLAAQVAARDPQRALRMAEESLAKGFSYELSDTLYQLQAQDKEAAAKLAASIVKKLQGENLLASHEATNIAAQLLRMEPRTEGETSGANPKQSYSVGSANGIVTVRSGPMTGLALDESTYRQLMETVVASVLSYSPATDPRNHVARSNAQNLLSTLQGMMPKVEKYAPGRATALRRRAADIGKTLDPFSRWHSENREVLERGKLEDLLQIAASAPPEVRPEVYQQAAWRALGQNEPERARQIINEFITNPVQRKQMLDQIENQARWRAINEGKIDEARQLIAQMRTSEERLQALVQLAMVIRGRGDARAALQLLDEARAQLGDRAQNQQQMQILFQIAQAYSQIEPARGFDVIEPVIDQLNELVAAAAVLNGFILNDFREGELVPQSGMISSTVQQCTYHLAGLAASDFDRAKADADRFQSPEARVMARLKVVGGVLNPQLGPGSLRPGRGGRIRSRF
jgi:hypothetical protein